MHDLWKRLSQQEEEKHAERNNSRALAPIYSYDLQKRKAYFRCVLNMNSVVHVCLQLLFQTCFAPI
jgi:hypothetical protein